MHRSERGRADGFTLVELLVVLSISALLLSGLAAFTIGQLRAGAQVDRQATDVGNGQLALTVLTRDLRTAVSPNPGESVPLFMVARPDRAEFFAALGDGQRPTLLRLYVDTDQRLVEDATPAASGTLSGTDLTWNPDGVLLDPVGEEVDPVPDDVTVTVGGDAAVRYVASFVVNDPGTPLFTYYAQDPSGLVELVPAVPADGLTLEQRRQIAVVEVTIGIASDPSGRTSRFLVTNRVRLPAALG